MEYLSRKIIQSVFFILVLSGCVTVSSTEPEAENMKEKPPEVKIETVERSSPFPGARTVISFPEEGAVLEEDDIYVVVQTKNFTAGVQTETTRADEISNSINGQHVHLIVDNKPYKAIYKTGEPVNIGKLSPGPHSIYAFPSRSYHESVKEPGASDVLNFYVANKEGVFEFDENKPAIFYSRPKGEYNGLAAKNIMLDFYLHNLKISPGAFNVKYTIRKVEENGIITDSYEFVLEEWKPAYIKDLPDGKYMVKIELVDPQGNFVSGITYNGTEREITVSGNAEN